MKKLLMALCFIGLSSTAGAWFGNMNWENEGEIAISTTNSPTKISQPTLIYVNRADKGTRDCFTNITWSGDIFPNSGATLYVLSNGATFYQVNMTTGATINYWDYQNPLCALNPGTTTWIYVSTGNYKVNAIGYQRK